MKHFFILALVFAFGIANAQKSYKSISFTTYNRSGNVLLGGSVGGGVLWNYASVGLGADVVTRSGNGIYTPVYTDARLFFNKSEGMKIFISAQTGYIFREYNYSDLNYSYTDKGDLFASLGVGILGISKKPDFTASLRASLLNTTTTQYQKGSDEKVSELSNRPFYFGVSVGMAF